MKSNSNEEKRQHQLRLGIDIGGTFTDFVLFTPATGEYITFKRLSTPEDPARAVIEGLQQLLQEINTPVDIIHGSTVATNALLERTGVKTALITTQGFKDVLQIGRQNRPSLYDLFEDPPPSLIPSHLRFEVDERVDSNGQILIPLDKSKIESVVGDILSGHVRSVAISLIFSFLHPEHERELADLLREKGLFVSTSSEVLPEYREYERTSTTAVNAYVSPVLDDYLGHLERAVSGGALNRKSSENSLRVLQSNGGSILPSEARRNGVRCVLSGPAGGIVGAEYLAQTLSISKVITFDMGGTSTDVSLIDGGSKMTTESVIGGCPIRIPVLDIHTIGAGGGSIASVDLGGALRVGPESAGADPGPACYGKGDIPTVTDANLVLGRLDSNYFLGGDFPLDVERAFQALSRLGRQLGVDAEQAALGVIEIANTHMERALRLISVERGYDPREFTLLSFGGAGGLHAADLARRMGIRRVLIPPMASTLSAFGMIAANVVKDYSRTVMLAESASNAEIEIALQPLIKRGVDEVEKDGISKERIIVQPTLDIRYKGQSYELSIPWLGSEENPRAAFDREHEKLYGYSRPDAEAEIVNIRVRVIGVVEKPVLEPFPVQEKSHLSKYQEKEVFVDVMKIYTPFHHGEALSPGEVINGPGIISRKDTTVVVPQDCILKVDGLKNFLLYVDYAN